MFFIFGISTGEKKLDYNQTIICNKCGQFGRLEIFMTYYYFSLFFIPIIKWGRQYIVRSTCCNKVYSLDKNIGNSIRKGGTVIISDRDLSKEYSSTYGQSYRKCSSCGNSILDSYSYCPKCGNKL